MYSLKKRHKSIIVLSKLNISQVNNLFPFIEREERRREKTRKKETLWEAKMVETSEETPLFTENTWLPLNQANVSSVL